MTSKLQVKLKIGDKEKLQQRAFGNKFESAILYSKQL